MSKDAVFEAIEAERGHLSELASRIWETPELGLREEESAETLVDALESEGFQIEQGVGGMPTAFVASYGEGDPTIGILGEFDALPNLSQQVVAERTPVEAGGPGHGCGHNLLGVAGVGAAIGVKHAIEAGRLDGTIRYFGCPAEEILVGKVFMARDGVFDDLDAALTWHPGDVTRPQRESSLALDSIQFEFEGTAAHAAAAPESGRSALDAVELMNVGVEYMREHLPDEARLHHVITKGGDAPNVVPEEATVWYYVRAPDRREVERISDWLTEVADGAATMTQTTVTRRFVTGCYDYRPNEALTDAVWRNLERLDDLEYTPDDERLAARLQDTLDAESVMETISNVPDSHRSQVEEESLYTRPIESVESGAMSGSTEVGDVSWIVPTAWFYAAANPVGTPLHSWQAVAANGSFGRKCAVYAAKAIAGTAYDLLTDPATIAAAWDEFEGGREYESPLPESATPPFDLTED